MAAAPAVASASLTGSQEDSGWYTTPWLRPADWIEPISAVPLPTILAPPAPAAGKPLILSDVGGASTVLKDGENGLLVENTDDPARLAEAMLRLSNPAALARHAAAAHARSRDYSLERMIGETEAIYRSLIA